MTFKLAIKKLDKTIQKIDKLSPKTLIILSTFFILSFANLAFPFLRFSFWLLNEIYFLIVCLIPFVLVLNIHSFKKRFTKIALWIILAIPLFISFVGGLSAAFTILSNNASFQQIEIIKMKNYQVSAYLTNGGATTDFGIAIRQEKYILPGIILVKPLYSGYHRSSIEYKIIDDDTIQIDIGYGKNKKRIDYEEFNLKKFLYF